MRSFMNTANHDVLAKQERGVVAGARSVSTTPDGVLYLSMELLKGTSLRAYLKKHRQRRKLLDVRLAIDVTLTGTEEVNGTTKTRTLSARFFPRNVLSN